MDFMVKIAIVFVLGVTFIPILLGSVKRNKSNRKFLDSILATIVSFNVIWYSVLAIEFIQNLTLSLNVSTAVSVISVTLMFLIRFVFLIAFLKLFQFLLNLSLTKALLNALKISGSIVLAIWILGLLEFFIFKSRIITSNLLIYTDILIFFIVIVSCIYLIYQTKLIYAPEDQNAIKLLSLIFLIPMILGFLKWLAGGIMEENSIRDQLSIPLLVLIMNGLISVWLIYYGNKLKKLKLLRKRIPLTSKLISKYKISKREMEVIGLICEGYTNKQIADELFISIETVKDHNSRIYLKTDVKNRTQLAKLFLKDA